MERQDKISPYRMSCLIKTASAMAELMTTGKYLSFPSHKECEIILEIIRGAIEMSKEAGE